MTDTAACTETEIEWLTDEEARTIFDEQARKTMGISGDEFLRRWDAGELEAIADGPDHPAVMRLAMLISFAR